MTRVFSLPAFALALALPAVAAQACPWAGGAYDIRDSGFYGDFSVNAGCTEIVGNWLQDDQKTSPLERTKHGWRGLFDRADVELLENGSSVRIYGPGGVARSTKAKPRG